MCFGTNVPSYGESNSATGVRVQSTSKTKDFLEPVQREIDYETKRHQVHHPMHLPALPPNQLDECVRNKTRSDPIGDAVSGSRGRVVGDVREKMN